MRFLIIDDVRTLSGTVGENGFLDEHIYARTYEEGIVQVTSKAGWDRVYLDHDLGNESDKTGYDIAQAIEKDAYDGILYPIGEFILISSNPVGRMRMFQALCKFYNVTFWKAD